MEKALFINGIFKSVMDEILKGEPHSPKSKIMEEASFVMNTSCYLKNPRNFKKISNSLI